MALKTCPDQALLWCVTTFDYTCIISHLGLLLRISEFVLHKDKNNDKGETLDKTYITDYLLLAYKQQII